MKFSAESFGLLLPKCWNYCSRSIPQAFLQGLHCEVTAPFGLVDPTNRTPLRSLFRVDMALVSGLKRKDPFVRMIVTWTPETSYMSAAASSASADITNYPQGQPNT
jgi:hypothetical protein